MKIKSNTYHFYIVMFFLALVTSKANSQTIDDAFRLSYSEELGTARSLGANNSMSVIGSDYGSYFINPAGLAWARKSELTLSPVLFHNETDANLDDSRAIERTNTSFNIGQFGLTVATSPKITSKWKQINFGIGYTRKNDFNSNSFYSGKSEGSITNRFLELTGTSNNSNPILSPNELDGFEAGLAYDTGAIYEEETTAGVFYVSDFAEDDAVSKNQSIAREGGINQMQLSFAGNYNEKLLIGATLGFDFLNFTETKVYNENDPNDEIEFFEQLRFDETLIQSGVGVSGNFGLIYRPIQALRVGLSIQTPTGYNIDDSFTTDLRYVFTDSNGQSDETSSSPEGFFEYRINTPWSYNFGLATIVKKYGFISLDVGYTDHSTSSFNFNNTNNAEDIAYEQELNDEIHNTFQGAINLKLGGEFAYKSLRVRGGYGYRSSPYQENDINFQSFTAGIGYLRNSFSIDFAFKNNNFQQNFRPYIINDTDTFSQPVISHKSNTQVYLLTLGFRF